MGITYNALRSAKEKAGDLAGKIGEKAGEIRYTPARAYLTAALAAVAAAPGCTALVKPCNCAVGNSHIETTNSGLRTSVVYYEDKDRRKIVVVYTTHSGSKGYYDKINKVLEGLDVVLDENVSEKGERSVANIVTNSPFRALRDVEGSIDDFLTNYLPSLKNQTEYLKPKENWIHADMTETELEKAAIDNMEDYSTPDLIVFMENVKNFPGQLKRLAKKSFTAAYCLTDMGVSYLIIGGEEYQSRIRKIMGFTEVAAAEVIGKNENKKNEDLHRIVIVARDKILFDKLDQSLKKGHKNIGMHRGAGHGPNVDNGLRERCFRERGRTWLQAMSYHPQKRK